MKSSAKNIVLKSVDDIFQTEENRADAQREQRRTGSRRHGKIRGIWLTV